MNNNEPIVLGKVKKGKTGKPLVVVIVFLFIGAFLLFMPTIINYFGDYNVIELITSGKIVDFIKNHESYMNKTITISKTTTTTKNKNELEKVLINGKSIIKYNNFLLNNFVLETTKITFDIEISNTINFDNSNYYLVLEKEGKTIQTLKIMGSVNQKETITLEFNKELDNILNIKGYIKEIDKADYPSITIPTDESGLGTIICTNKDNVYEYTFYRANLISILHTYTYNKNEVDNYDEIYDKYLLESNTLNLFGATSSITENNEGFVMKTNIDLKTYQNNKTNLKNYYYSLDTKAKVIHFEMNTKGYDCK